MKKYSLVLLFFDRKIYALKNPHKVEYKADNNPLETPNLGLLYITYRCALSNSTNYDNPIQTPKNPAKTTF